jgi:hypothetical protein
VGKNHETIGSDILAVLAILKLPDQVLGAEEAKRLREVDPNGWYPIEWLVELMETLSARIGQYGLLRMGRTLFKMSHEKRFREVARSARDAIYGIDAMYHFANRGEGIGGWKVLKFEPGYAELEKNTPHHCVMEQGILHGALAALGTPGTIAQRDCFRSGGEVCVYTVTSAITDERWTGVPAVT